MNTNQTRPAFTKQPIQYIFVDLCQPMQRENLDNICDSLSDVLVISCSIRGSCRIPMLELTVLTGQNPAVCLFPLQTIKGNFQQISSALVALRSMTAVDKGNDMNLTQALDTATRKIKSNIRSGPYHMQITLISMQPINHLAKQVGEALKAVDIENIKKFQILALFTASSVTGKTLSEEMDIGQCEVPSLSGSEQSVILSELLDTVSIRCNSYALDGFFRGWLHDFSTDKEHFNLRLSSQVIVKCDLHEPLLNPGAFLYSNCYFLSTDPLVSYGPMVNYPGNENNDLPTYELEATKLVSTDSLCESLIYGMPLLLHPTSCWRMEWADLELNRHRFQSLRHSLQERDCVLLARMKPLFQAAKFYGQTPYGHFAIFASEMTATLLIKPVACRELLLPPIDGGERIGNDFIPREVQSETDCCLDKLPRDDRFNPVYLESELLPSLKVSLANTELAMTQNESKAKPLAAPRRVIRFNVPATKRFQGFRPASIAFPIEQITKQT